MKFSFVILLIFPLFCFSQVTGFFNQSKIIPSGGGGLDVDVEAWVDEIDVQGGTAPSASQLLDIDTLVRDLKTNGLWAKFDGFHVMAQDGSEIACRVNMIDPGGVLDLVPIGTISWTSNVGQYISNNTSVGFYDVNSKDVNLQVSGPVGGTGNDDRHFGFALDTVSNTMYVYGRYSSTLYYTYFSGTVLTYWSFGGPLNQSTSSRQNNIPDPVYVYSYDPSAGKSFFYDDGVVYLRSHNPTPNSHSAALGCMYNGTSTNTYRNNNSGSSITVFYYGARLTTTECDTLRTIIKNYTGKL
jgi:hypothetical protein